jgi:hypothetical protein
MANCRSCGALITWIKLVPGGTLHPLDPEPRIDGTIALTTAGEGRVLSKAAIALNPEAELYRSHFASCEQAAQWRRRG